MTKSKKLNTRVLTESAIMLAIASILSIYPKLDGIWPNGGSITICSMLPIVIVSYRHSIKWGLLAGFAFGIINILTGQFYTPANSIGIVAAVGLLDYILPYTVIGLGGVFKNVIKNPALALVCGVCFSFTLRYLCHIISGYMVWYDLAYATNVLSSEGFAFGIGSWLSVNLSGNSLFTAYNLLYNASYMLPEIIISSVGAVLLSKFIANSSSRDIPVASA